MRVKKGKTKPASRGSSADKQFARLYHGIPASGLELADAPPRAVEKPRWRKYVKRGIITLLVAALLAVGWVGGKFIYNGIKIFGWQGFLSLFTTSELKGESEGRVNLLLAGNSVDNPGHSGAELTDSIMLVSINTEDNRAYMMSIPRDLYINIPDYGYAKINEAYQAGERGGFAESGYPPGGMGLLQKIISDNFDAPIHYHALVSYTALEETTDALGGIDLVIDSSDPRGLYDPSLDLQTRQPLVDLPNGKVTLDGRQALNLARARGQGFGSYGFARADFDRTKHQRQIIAALAAKAKSLGTLGNPITLGKLFDAIGQNIDTDMTMGEARRLYQIMNGIDDSRVQSIGLNDAGGQNLLSSYRTPNGLSALIPRAGIDNYTEIQTFISSLR